MYRCKQCYTTLTTLDIEFGKQHKQNQNASDFSCINCQIGSGIANDLKQFCPVTLSNIVFHLLPYVLGGINGICFGFFHLTLENPATILLIISTVVVGYLVCPIAVLKTMYQKWDVYEDEYFKGTIKSDNVLEIERVPGRYVSQDNSFGLFLAWWFFPMWSAFHLIYLLLKQRKFKKKYSADIVDAYIIAYKSAKRSRKKSK